MRKHHPASRTPSRTPSRKGAVLHIAIGAIAAAAITWMGIASVTGPSTSGAGTSAKRLKFRSPSTPIEIEAALGELGLTPKVLTAAGLSAEQTQALASAWASSMRSRIPDYRAAMDATFQASTEANRLQRLIQGGAASAEDLTAFSAAQSSLTTARAQRQAVLDEVYNAGTANLNPNTLSLLNTVRTNHRRWDIPETYLGDNRSERDWVNLRDALANDRISSSLQKDPDPACHQLLLTAQATPNAAAALANSPNLHDIQTAWNASFNP